MGTTKLTRKEILAEDPVHGAIMQLIEFFKANGKKIGTGTVIAVLIALAVYAGLQYLDRREFHAQEQLGKGMSFFHGQVAADAKDDPYAKGPNPTFRSDEAKYQAAAKEFSSIVDRYGFSKVSIVARYYLGLSQLRLGKRKEAIQNLESVASNSKERTLGYLAKRVLATDYANSGNYKGAAEILAGMIKDPLCQIPKEEMSIQLSKVLVAQGKAEDAAKVLTEAGSQEPAFSAYKQQLTIELEKLKKPAAAGSEQKAPRP